MHTITKQYRDLPAAHRQHQHDGHCAKIHGHNWGFDITFGCDMLDANGFVLDVGKMKAVKEMLEKYFDHKLLLNVNDPLLAPTIGFPSIVMGCLDIVVVPNCSMEALAEMVFKEVGRVLLDNFGDTFARNIQVLSVTCWEDSKNSATYRP